MPSTIFTLNDGEWREMLIQRKGCTGVTLGDNADVEEGILQIES